MNNRAPGTSRLVFDNVRFSYPDNDWSLSIPELRFGQERVACLVGPNGSGKSTLLRIAAGIIEHPHGSVFLDEIPLLQMPRRLIARRIGFLPQESLPLFDYSVEMVARMGRYAHAGWTGAMSDHDKRAVDKALLAMEMDNLRNRPLSRLSGGERRRALIAAVLAQEPDILLLDEPTAALDLHHAAAVMRLLSGPGTAGRVVVIVTHDINLAALFADRMLMLAKGSIVADGAPGQVVCSEVIRQAYGDDIIVMEHPETGDPMVMARR